MADRPEQGPVSSPPLVFSATASAASSLRSRQAQGAPRGQCGARIETKQPKIAATGIANMSIDSASRQIGGIVLAADDPPVAGSGRVDASALGARWVRVWDPLVRGFHWSLVAAFTTAFVVEDSLLGVHVWAGYLALGLVLVRIAWGFIGTRHARFSDFVCKPRRVIGYIRDAVRLRAARYLGHNPAGGAMVLVLLALVASTGISGLALYGAQELSGPLAALMSGLPPAVGHRLEELHEVLANLTLALIVLHVAGVLFSSLAHHENLALAMLTGRKPDRSRPNR
jgi:cytochrome b